MVSIKYRLNRNFNIFCTRRQSLSRRTRPSLRDGTFRPLMPLARSKTRTSLMPEPPSHGSAGLGRGLRRAAPAALIYEELRVNVRGLSYVDARPGLRDRRVNDAN